MSTVGDRIKEMRMRKGLSQNKLAKLSCMSQSGLSSIENGSVSPKQDSLSVIASALGCTAAELMGEDVDTRQPTDNEIRFALFGGDSKEISDAQFEEVKRFAQFIRERDRRDK